MRCSGDIGLLKDGKLYYVERKDNRIKLFGQFVDLEVIEVVVEALPGVRAAVCAASKTNMTTKHSYLILFVSISGEFVEEDFRQRIFTKLREKLPAYFVPHRVVFASSIPLTMHGKKDRSEVQSLADRSFAGDDHLQVQSSLEQTCLGIMKNALKAGSENASVYDTSRSFIENGGNSVMAVFVENEIRNYIRANETGVNSFEKVKLLVLFDYILSKDLESLVEYVKQELGKIAIEPISIDNEEILERGSLNSECSHVSETRSENDRYDDSDKGFVSSPKRFKEDEISCSSLNCYCSVSRGNRTTLCRPCAREGRELSCFECGMKPSCCSTGINLGIMWKINTHKCVDASPLVVCCGEHCVAYIGSHSHRFLAIKLDDGRILWDTKLGDRVESSACLSRDGQKIIVGW